MAEQVEFTVIREAIKYDRLKLQEGLIFGIYSVVLLPNIVDILASKQSWSVIALLRN